LLQLTHDPDNSDRRLHLIELLVGLILAEAWLSHFNVVHDPMYWTSRREKKRKATSEPKEFDQQLITLLKTKIKAVYATILRIE